METDPDAERTMLADLGAAAAYYLQTTLRSGDKVGISSWSASLLAMVQAMQPVPGLKDVRIIQAVGGVGDPAAAAHASRLSGQLAGLVNGEAVFLQAPGLAGTADSARALREDPYVAATLSELDGLDVALVGIGEITPSSTLARSGNTFSDAERAALEDMGPWATCVCGSTTRRAHRWSPTWTSASWASPGTNWPRRAAGWVSRAAPASTRPSAERWPAVCWTSS